MDINGMVAAADQLDSAKQTFRNELLSLEKIRGEVDSIYSEKIKQSTQLFLLSYKKFFSDRNFIIEEKEESIKVSYKSVSLYLFGINYQGEYMSFRDLHDEYKVSNFCLRPDDKNYPSTFDISLGSERLYNCLGKGGKVDYEKFINRLHSVSDVQKAIETVRLQIKALERSMATVNQTSIEIVGSDHKKYDSIESLIGSF